MPALDLIVEFPLGRTLPERSCLRPRAGMPDNDDRNPAITGPVHRPENITEAAGRVGYRQLTGKIFVLDIDDRQGFFHAVSPGYVSGDPGKHRIVPYPRETN